MSENHVLNSLPDTVTLVNEEGRDVLEIIDQTLLPGEVRLLHLKHQKDIWEAIRTLRVRGAPAIGVAAAIGLYLAAVDIAADITGKDCENGHRSISRKTGVNGNDAHITSENNGADDAASPAKTTFFARLHDAKTYLASSRPTAVNLFWALDRMERTALNNRMLSFSLLLPLLRQEAENIRQEDMEACRRLGEYGLSLLHDGDGILTHCNAGQLAAVRYGTALAPIHLGLERGYHFHVYCDETRPLLQGARLSAFELQAHGADTTVICDNMASQVMKNGWIRAVIVGADRIAANGDACNKIGTSGVAILARHYGVPFYVAAPTSTIDTGCASGSDIPIEQRAPEEVSEMFYRAPMTPEGIGIYNPAFDCTPAELITAIITEHGILYPPFDTAIDHVMNRKNG